MRGHLLSAGTRVCRDEQAKMLKVLSLSVVWAMPHLSTHPPTHSPMQLSTHSTSIPGASARFQVGRSVLEK